MTEPVLVVDFGTSSSAAAVVLDRGERLVKEPSSGLLSWPSAVSVDPDGRLLVGSAAEHRKRAEPSGYRAEFKRDLGERAPVPLGGRQYAVADLVAAVLAEFRAQGQVMIGRGIDRLVVTVPASYGPVDPRREAMLTAGAAAGFRSVELLAEPVAAAHATVAGEPFAAGETVLVYDFGGGTFDTALVRIGADGAAHTVLGHAALDDCGGRDIDALLAGRIRERGRDWLEPLLGAGGAGALRAQLELGDFVRRIKHQLTESTQVEDYLTPLGPASRVARDELDVLIGPLLDRTVICCRQLLADCGVRARAVDSVLLVGGTTRIPAVRALLADRLSRPLRLVEDPDLAVVHGAAAWAARSADRRLSPLALPAHNRPLAWGFPAPTAELADWAVPPAVAYPAGATLGSLRLPDGSLWELTADEPGTVVRQLAAPGTAVGPGEWLLAVQPLGAPDPAASPGYHAPPGYQPGHPLSHPPGYPPAPPPGRPVWRGRTGTAMLALFGAVVLGYGLLGLLDQVDPGQGMFLLLGYAALVALVAAVTAAARGVAGTAGPAVGAAVALTVAVVGWVADASYRRPNIRLPFDASPVGYQLQTLGTLLLGTALVAAALSVRRRGRGDDAVAWRTWLRGLLGAVLAVGATWFAAGSPWPGYDAFDAVAFPLVALPCLVAALAGGLAVRGATGGSRPLLWTGLALGAGAVALVAARAGEFSGSEWIVILAGGVAAAGGVTGLGLAAADRLGERVSGLPVASWCALYFAGLVVVNGALR
ncbi:Hsp70 family protein [Kitasatospora sp. NPDC093806]|uniref:Hsp70 family protein n=1 Tax=Kitasatospora sp. NPDC093806 TaxID=3155075 RepID=UPI00341F58AF